jgi:3-(3-hydroxy-phenyl)propionate hydroxylase
MSDARLDVARFDVAIVGYGPTGATLANLLGALGMRVAVIEREPDLLPLPRAVHFDGEVMRLFETAGLAGALAPRIRPSGGMRYVNIAGQIMLERAPAVGAGPHGWANNYLFHQPDLEYALRKGAERHPGVHVMRSHEVTALEQDRDGATLAVERLADRAALSIRADYVVGCCGARSIVRQAIGADHDDLGLHQPWLVVDVVLERDVALPEQTVQYCDPARPVTFVKVTGRRRRWEIMLMPGDAPEQMTREETVWRLLAPWLKPGDARIERGALYTFHSLVASRWRDRRLLIAGDAAHQTPPFLGQGMCAGIRDAANLAWKVARVARGVAPDTLLDTYQTEREAHVRVFIDTAVRLGGIIQTTDPQVAAERDRRFLATGKEEIVNLAPRLGPGVHTGDPPAGEVFPQPRLADGRRLDAAIGGYRFALLADRALTSPALAERCKSSDIATVPADGEAGEWLRRHGACAVLLRPDRYIYGLARDGAGLEALIEPLLVRAEALS